jgi:hypothetical protein
MLDRIGCELLNDQQRILRSPLIIDGAGLGSLLVGLGRSSSGGRRGSRGIPRAALALRQA